jgi:hypothetical protein
MPYLVRALAIWFLIMLVETLHGIARRLLLEPRIGDFQARQIAVFTGSILIMATAFLFVRSLKTTVTKELLLVGIVWVILTLVFEVLIGRYAMNLPWDGIFSDYDLFHGGLMPIGLLEMFLAPLIAAKIRFRLISVETR